MKIVTHVPPSALPLRAGRVFVLGGGYLLIVLPMILAIPAFALMILVPVAVFSGDQIGSSIWIALTGSALGGLLLFWLGMRLARGCRHLVLFLRRFGFGDASETLTYAVNRTPFFSHVLKCLRIDLQRAGGDGGR